MASIVVHTVDNWLRQEWKYVEIPLPFIEGGTNNISHNEEGLGIIEADPTYKHVNPIAHQFLLNNSPSGLGGGDFGFSMTYIEKLAQPELTFLDFVANVLDLERRFGFDREGRKHFFQQTVKPTIDSKYLPFHSGETNPPLDRFATPATAFWQVVGAEEYNPVIRWDWDELAKDYNLNPIKHSYLNKKGDTSSLPDIALEIPPTLNQVAIDEFYLEAMQALYAFQYPTNEEDKYLITLKEHMQHKLSLDVEELRVLLTAYETLGQLLIPGGEDATIALFCTFFYHNGDEVFLETENGFYHLRYITS